MQTPNYHIVEVEALRRRAEKAERERDIFRAVLDGAGYENLDRLATTSVELARKLGMVAARRTIALRIQAERF